MEALFADVIMPLSIPRLLTYRVPKEMWNEVFPGSRVIVQVKRKLYTGIVRNLHHQVPEGWEALYLVSVLDIAPILNPIQLEFWDWLSSYYLCSPGDILNASLPGHLRLNSDSMVVLSAENTSLPENLSPKEEAIFIALHEKGSLPISEVEKLLNQVTVMQHIKKLMDKGLVTIKEEIKESYKPKMEGFVSLNEAIDQEQLGLLLDNLEKKAPKQVDVLMRFLQKGQPFSKNKQEVSKSDLIKGLDGADTALKALEKKGILLLYEKEVGRFGFVAEIQAISELSPVQEEKLNEIHQLYQNKSVVLLKGVTSSGKTEIYIRLIEHVLQSRNEILYLLPEIAITAQIISRLRKVFGHQVLVYHSRLSQNERVDVWRELIQRQQKNEKLVIVGPRSSLLLPFYDLGLVIVDEEHDPNFKQQENPRYHARDASIWLALKHKAKVLLGSATPSIESWYNAQTGKYGLVELNTRFGGVALPEFKVADLKDLNKKKQMKSIFSPELLEAIKTTTEKGKQVMLFQNRRGFSPSVECQSCSWMPQCTNCDVTLTYHKNSGQLRCHYCGYSSVVPTVCSNCGDTQIKTVGFGTEKVEEELSIFFPNLKLGRMDLDTTRSRAAYDRIFSAFSSGDTQILVGTQMISKGLDFANVGLVGILNADAMLGFPDFRSFERAYQMLVQVSGRAGRRKEAGQVIIQTKNKNHPVLKWVMEQDFTSLVQHEFMERQKFSYPPYCHLISLSLRHVDNRLLDRAAFQFSKDLRQFFGERVLGPAYPVIPRIRNQYQNCIMLKIEKNASYAQAKTILRNCIDKFKASEFRAVQVSIDVDA
ncbi:MAG: primosomal protein N' [Bacteroidia bacterium]|nr:primosomal protein N' [Bacteroidia bacterium]